MKKLKIFLTLLTILCLCGSGYYIYKEREKKDITPPVLKSSAERMEVSIYATDEELKAPVSAVDPEEGDVSDKILIEGIQKKAESSSEIPEFQIQYAAFDSAGNSAELTIDLFYTDYVAPHFFLSKPLIFTEGETVNLLECITAEDVLDGDITPFVTVEGAEKLSENPPAGIYACELSVVNGVGDTAVLPVRVYVREPVFSNIQKPSIILTDYLVYLKQGDFFEASAYLDHVEDGGYCQIDYGEMVEKLDKNGKPVKDTDGNTVYVTEQAANGSQENWVNISAIESQGYVDTSRKGVYTVQYSYTSPRTEAVSDTILLVVIE